MSVILDGINHVADVFNFGKGISMVSSQNIEPAESGGLTRRFIPVAVGERIHSEVSISGIADAFSKVNFEAGWAESFRIPAWMHDHGDKKRIRRKARKLLKVTPGSITFLVRKLKREARQK